MEDLLVNIVIEILGRPKEHIKEALQSLVLRLGEEKGIKILDKTIHEPIPVKDTKDLFTTFAEVSLSLDSITNYFGVLFGYMPSHIELVNPEKLSLTNFDLNELGNKLVQRLHDYDAITKNVLVEKDMLLKKLQEVAPHLFQKPQQAQQVQQQANQNQQKPKEQTNHNSQKQKDKKQDKKTKTQKSKKDK